MSYHTGQPYNQIEIDTDRDFFMSPLEAKEYGLIDGVIGGDEAGLKLKGSTKKFGKKNTKHIHLSWYEELQKEGRSIEELEVIGARGAAFNPEPVIPFMKNLYDDEEDSEQTSSNDESEKKEAETATATAGEKAEA